MRILLKGVSRTFLILFPPTCHPEQREGSAFRASMKNQKQILHCVQDDKTNSRPRHGKLHRLIDCAAFALHRRLGDHGHGARRLLAAHHGSLCVRPRKTKARMKAAPTHAIVPRAERGAAKDRDLRQGRIRHRLDHLRAMLNHARFFVSEADHLAVGVIEVKNRRARLTAGLNEVPSLRRAVAIDRTVVGDNA